MTSAFFWENSFRLCPASFCTPRPNLPVTSDISWLPTFAFQSPIMKVQFSRSVVSDSLWPHESQHSRPRCPSQTPGVHPDLRPSSQWCHPAISSSIALFSACPQSFPVSGSFEEISNRNEVGLFFLLYSFTSQKFISIILYSIPAKLVHNEKKAYAFCTPARATPLTDLDIHWTPTVRRRLS